MLELPFHAELSSARNIIVAGCGGGFDVFSGLPIYFALRAAGKKVSLANLSFSYLPPNCGRRPVPELVEVSASSPGNERYFPEKYLAEWFVGRGDETSIWCIERRGPASAIRAYQALVEEVRPDTIILIDGGTDSLMRGDESGLGTPVEDVSSIAAVQAVHVPRKLHVCLGFGIDDFHGVSHFDVLRSISELIRSGGYLGAFSLQNEMPEVRAFREATEYVLDRTRNHPSIVCTSILAALAGHFGDHHSTDRTAGNELFINPLMSLYWCFQLDAVAKRILYLDGIRELEGFEETEMMIELFRDRLPARAKRRSIPL